MAPLLVTVVPPDDLGVNFEIHSSGEPYRKSQENATTMQGSDENGPTPSVKMGFQLGQDEIQTTVSPPISVQFRQFKDQHKARGVASNV